MCISFTPSYFLSLGFGHFLAQLFLPCVTIYLQSIKVCDAPIQVSFAIIFFILRYLLLLMLSRDQWSMSSSASSSPFTSVFLPLPSYSLDPLFFLQHQASDTVYETSCPLWDLSLDKKLIMSKIFSCSCPFFSGRDRQSSLTTESSLQRKLRSS